MDRHGLLHLAQQQRDKTTMDFAQLAAFLTPALKALLPVILSGVKIDPTTPMGMLARDILAILPRFGTTPGAPPPDVALPPESEWTPEGITAHYEARCRAAAPGSPKPA